MMATMEAGKYVPFCVRSSDGEYIDDGLEKELMTTGTAKDMATYHSDEDCEDIRDCETMLYLVQQKLMRSTSAPPCLRRPGLS